MKSPIKIFSIFCLLSVIFCQVFAEPTTSSQNNNANKPTQKNQSQPTADVVWSNTSSS